MLQKLIFYIYTIVSSDNRYKENDRVPVYVTIFLLSFFELFILLPILLGLNSAYKIISIQSFITFPIYIRYLLIALLILFVYFMNYYLFGRTHKIALLKDKFKEKKAKYLKYKWLLMVFAMIFGGIILFFLRMIKTNI